MRKHLQYPAFIRDLAAMAVLSDLIAVEQHRQPVHKLTGEDGYRQAVVTVAPEVPRWKPQHFKRTGSKFF